jgi:NhaA family Na+:H+ antiporter
VAFLIMPVFALANAGVEVHVSALGHPVAVAVALGLLLGKPAGILLAVFLAVRSGLARLPERTPWSLIAAGGVLSGIGFTMALFIAGLALDEGLLASGKIGILAGSALSAILGMGLMRLCSRLPAA